MGTTYMAQLVQPEILSVTQRHLNKKRYSEVARRQFSTGRYGPVQVDSLCEFKGLKGRADDTEWSC